MDLSSSFALGRAHNWTSASKGRVPLMIVALLDVLRAFPGEIPDLDGVLSTADVPCVPRRVVAHPE